MAADLPASAAPEAEPELDSSGRPVQPPSEQRLAEFNELYPDDSPEDEEPSSEERNVPLKDLVLRPKCSRCIIFRDNCIGYLNTLADLSPRIGELEALRPEIKMLKKLNADLTTQLEDSIRSEQTLKAQVTAGNEENEKIKAQLESLEKDYYSLAKAAEEGKKHAHEASVWRVKYEKTLDICEKLQDKRKRETANFEKLLNLAEGYKKELDTTKAKAQEEKAQHVVWASASKRYVPRLYALLKTIMSDSNMVAQLSSKSQAEAAKLCAPEVKKALRVPVDFDEEEDEESVLLERLLNAESTSAKEPQLDEPSGSGLDTSAKKVEASLHKPISDIPAVPSPATDLLLSELNDEEADELIPAGAEALTSTPSKSAAKRGGGSARGRGRGARRGRGSKQTPASVDHDSIDRRFDEMLQSKLKRSGTNEASDLGSGGLKHMSIHGKKTMTVREQQQAQMKVSIKERVAMMKNLEKAKESVSETLDGGEGSSKDTNTAKTVDADSQINETTSPTKSSYSVRNDLVMSASPSPASSVAEEPIAQARDEATDKGADAHEFLALEEFGTLEEAGTPRNVETENESAAAVEIEVVPSSVDTHEELEPLARTLELSGEVAKELPVEQVVDEPSTESSEIHPQAVVDEDILSTEQQQTVEEPQMADNPETSNAENTEGSETVLHVAGGDLETPQIMEEEVPEGEATGEIAEAVGSTPIDTIELTAEDATTVEVTFEGSAAEDSREALLEKPSDMRTSVEMSVNVEAHQHIESGPQEEVANKGAVAVAEEMEAPAAESIQPDEVANAEKEMSVLVKPPKPHLAKDTKRALGLMRRLEVDLKDVVEPIPDAEGTKKRLSTDVPSSEVPEQSPADTLEASTTDTAVVDEERDHEEAMKLHAALNLPSLRTRKDSEQRSRDGNKEGLSKADAPAKVVGRKRSINAQPISDSTSQSESSHKIEDKSNQKKPPAIEVSAKDKSKQKEPPAVEQTDMNDIVGSILAGAHTATVASTTVNAVSTQPHPDVLENSSGGTLSEANASKSDADGNVPQLAPKALDSAKLSGARKSRVKTTQKSTNAEPAPDILAAVSGEQTAVASPMVSLETKTATVSADDKARVKRRGRPLKRERPSVILASAKSPVEIAEEAKTRRRSAVSPPSSSAHATNEEANASVQESSEMISGAVTELSSLPDEPPVTASTLPTVSKSSENMVEQATGKQEMGGLQTGHDTKKKARIVHDTDNAAPAVSGPSEPHKETEQAAGKQEMGGLQTGHDTRKKASIVHDTDNAAPAVSGPSEPHKETTSSSASSRKRQPEPPSRPILPKRSKLTHLQPISESSPALHTRRRGSTASPLEILDFSIPTRTRTRTGPVAPKRRKPVEESKVEEPMQQKETLSELSTDDEDRLCIAEHNEGEAQSPPVQASELGKQTVAGLEEEADDEERLVIANEEDEEREASTVEKAAGDVTTAPEVTAEKAALEDRRDEGAVNQPSLPLHDTRSSSKGITKEDVSSSTYESDRNLDTKMTKTPRPRSGVLQAVRRSLAKPGSGPATMQRLSSRIAKQLQQSGSGAVTRTSAIGKRASRTPQRPSEITKPLPPEDSAPTKINLRSSGPADDKYQTSGTQRESSAGRKVSARGLKRRVEESTEKTPKKAAAVENTLQKKLHGVLTSEQRIEVIRNTLGEDVDAISKMDPNDFASTLMKCSLNLQSGDMWTLVLAMYNISQPGILPNKKEEMLFNTANELAGGPHIWVPYVKKLVMTIASQPVNAVNTTRYVRLLCRALCHAGDLLPIDDKKNYLRAALVRIFLNDASVAIKATTYALLSPAAEWLEWLNEKNDPFLGDGKILLWAWFEQFSRELQVLDVSPASLRKTFDELLEQLDKLAASRAHNVVNDSASLHPTAEETALMNIAISYFPPGSGATVVAKTVVDEILKDCVNRIKTALNLRTRDGDREWPKALMVDCRLRICINLALKAVLYKDATLSREFCALLQSDIPLVRDLRHDVEKSVEERPWMRVYRDVINDVLGLMQTLTSYEL